MISNFRLFVVAAIAAFTCTAAFTSTAPAQQATFYDDGVNAFFAGRSFQAESFLSSAIEANSQDPRCYYFRALSLLRQGRCDVARGDMLVGATLEAQQPNRYAIGHALERVQGPDRLMLEEFRRSARRSAVTQASATMAVPGKNQTYRADEAEVLRQRQTVPLEELLRPGGPQAVPDEGPTELPTLPPQGKAAGAERAVQPAAQPGAAAPDPFADDSQKAAAPKAAPVPPSPPPVPPQTKPKSATPPPPDAEDPFGGS